MSQDVLRIIDANLNRISEGLRVLEEFSRLKLDDTGITQQLKNLRHNLGVIPNKSRGVILTSRDAGNDVGNTMVVPGEEISKSILDLVASNARRVEESLRVMEEMSKLPDTELDVESYRKARFALYTLEKEITLKFTRKEKLDSLKGLYLIIDAECLRGRDAAVIAGAAIRGGARVIQFRDKVRGIRDMLADAIKIRDVCRENNRLFIVNDSLEVALAVDADGLHVGQGDMPVDIARRLLAVDKLIGCSARTIDEAENACRLGADHLGVGAIYATKTKNAEVVGVERLAEIKKAVNVPLVAIGGIDKQNIAATIKAGAAAACIISAVMDKDDIESATRNLVSAMEEGNDG
jgi:thiamine-phosphate pyrophosphorylase